MSTAEPTLGTPTGTGTRPGRVEDVSTPIRLVETVARRSVEIVRDMRPVTDLRRVVTPEISAMLERRASLTRRLRGVTGQAPDQHIAVSGVHTCVVNPHTVEASAVLREPGRARFLAMRWELRHSGWRVTVLEIG